MTTRHSILRSQTQDNVKQMAVIVDSIVWMKSNDVHDDLFTRDAHALPNSFSCCAFSFTNFVSEIIEAHPEMRSSWSNFFILKNIYILFCDLQFCHFLFLFFVVCVGCRASSSRLFEKKYMNYMVDLGVKPKVATHFDSTQLVHVNFRLAFRLPNYSNDLNNFNYMSTEHTGQKVTLQYY